MRGRSARTRVSAKSVALFGLLIASACAEQEDTGLEFSKFPGDSGGSSGVGGTLPTAGVSNIAGKGGTTNSAGSGGAGRGGSGGGRGGSSSNGGSAGSNGSSGSHNTSGSSNSGGSGSAGSPALGCIVAAGGSGGMPAEGGAPGAAGSAEAAGAPGFGGVPGDPGSAGAAGEPGSAGAGMGGDGAAGAAGSSSGPVTLFFDDFEDENADGWEVSGGTWAVTMDGSFVYQQSLLQNQRQFSMVSGSCWADQIVEARMKIMTTTGQSNSYIGAIFARALGDQTHYMLAIGSDGKLVIRKRINSTSTSATQIGSTYSPTPKLAHSTWYTLRLEAIGSTLNGYLDGVLRVTANDASIASGGVAVGTVNRAAVFDDVRVTSP